MSFQAPLPDDLRQLVTILRHCQLVETPTVSGTSIDLDEMVEG